MKIRAKFDLTIYGQDINGNDEDTHVSAGDEFVVTDYKDVSDDTFEVTINGEWAMLIKSDWEIIKDMTYKEFRQAYYQIDEYWKVCGCVKVWWTLWEHSELGDEAPMIATNGNVYVYTQDDLETTVDCLEDYILHSFEED
jgi:hypothetical protein